MTINSCTCSRTQLGVTVTALWGVCHWIIRIDARTLKRWTYRGELELASGTMLLRRSSDYLVELNPTLLSDRLREYSSCWKTLIGLRRFPERLALLLGHIEVQMGTSWGSELQRSNVIHQKGVQLWLTYCLVQGFPELENYCGRQCTDSLWYACVATLTGSSRIGSYHFRMPSDSDTSEPEGFAYSPGTHGSLKWLLINRSTFICKLGR